ncbi:MAG: DUF362 domain-containing protein [Phycisphaerales bacterium]|nr:DUF362 domain-containing protein [Phycisphaerales bacterium]
MIRGSLDDNRGRRVGVGRGMGAYDAEPPYAPGEDYPELSRIGVGTGPRPNHGYGLVRRALERAGLDASRFGTAEWNPLAGIVRPGDTVVLKPNLVREFRETQEGHADCVITHGSVIRAVVDYVYLALGGNGRIIVADAPHNDASFEAVARIAGLESIRSYYRDRMGFDVSYYDLRPECAEKVDGVIVGHRKLTGDPCGYVKVNLGVHSAFAEVNHLCHLLYGSEYDTRELHSHQHGDVHEYLISGTVLGADCVISLPKLKTHKKTGITVNMKNLVGINGNKNWLPHHREGTPSQGGDQFANDGIGRRIERAAVAQFKRVFPHLGRLRRVVAGPVKAAGKRVFGDTNVGTIRSGNWHGNDTTWRMVIDLNRILMYADARGRMNSEPVRRFFSVVDGVVAGEGNGPMDPRPKAAGLVIAGGNSVAVDLACATLMGFDYRRLPVLDRALADHPWPLATFASEDVRVFTEGAVNGLTLDALGEEADAFEPHFGWKGHVELRAAEAVTRS